jgi:hypothetical protein
MKIGWLTITLCFAGMTVAQTSGPGQDSGATRENAKIHTSAKNDVGSGAGDIGKGAAKGAGSAAVGAGKAAGDLVTLHPVHAATDLGVGAAKTGKNVGAGTVKGTGKIFKGTGKAIKHLL